MAQDLILFFVFFEVVLLPMYFMIGVWGGENRQYASLKFFLYTLFGSAFMLVGFLALFFKTGGQDVRHRTLADRAAASPRVRASVPQHPDLIFAGMFLGFAIKVPMFPFHTWLPDAHTQAPTQGSVILAAILLKLGTYGFIRIAIPILPQAAKEWAPWIGLLAVIGIIYGALRLSGPDRHEAAHRLLVGGPHGLRDARHLHAHQFGVNAAMFGMVAHGLITGMLFFVAGSVKERYHTLEIKRLSGMLKQVPKLGWILGFCAMASLGLPGLAGFWGEFPAILSAYQPADGLPVETFRTFMVVAAVGTVLAAGYLLWLYQRTAFGEPTEEFAGATSTPAGTTPTATAPTHQPLAKSVSAAANDDHHSDIHDVDHLRVDRLDAAAAGDRRPRHLPGPDLQGDRPRRQGRPLGLRRLTTVLALAARPGECRSRHRRSITTPWRPRSSWPRSSLWRDPRRPLPLGVEEVPHGDLRRHRAARRARSPCSPSRSTTARRARCSAAATSSTTSRWC